MKKILFAFLLSLLLALGGCTTELYHQLLIKGFGVDRDANGYLVTVRSASLKDQGGEELTEVRGKTVYDALNKLSLTTGKKPLYANAGYMIFGKVVGEEGLDQILDFFVRYFKARPTIHLFMAENTAKELLVPLKDQKLASSDSIRAYTEGNRNLGKTTAVTAMEFISNVKMGGADTVIPVIRKEKEELSCTTAAAFHGYKFNTFFSEEETRGFLAAKGQLRGESFVSEGKTGEKITSEITQTTAKLSHTMQGGEPKFSLQIHANAILASVTLSHNGLSYAEIENLISERITDCAKKALKKSLKNKSDTLRFGRHLYLHETEYWRQTEANWPEMLPRLLPEIKTTVSLTRIGEEDKPPF